MSERDYSKQVARRQRIGSTSLVVGVDVGKAYNAVGFMDKEGKVLGNCAKVYNSRKWFEQFLKMVEDLKARHGLKDVLVGMEPTGHYWRKLAYFAKEHGYEVRRWNMGSNGIWGQIFILDFDCYIRCTRTLLFLKK